jgi:O-antigen/teichoic acid export membrane protein
MIAILTALERRFRVVTFASTMVPTMAALFLQFVTFAITARGLGVEQFGLYTAVLAFAAVGMELVGLGGADLLVRGVARDRRRFGAYYGNMLLLFAGTLPLVVVSGTWLGLGPMRMHVGALELAAALTAEVASARMSASLELVMVAHGHVVRAGWVRVAAVGTRLGVALLFFIALGYHELADWIAAMCVQSALLCVACAVVGSRLYGAPTCYLPIGELGTGAAFCAAQVARASQSNVDRLVLTRFTDDAALGAYGAATRVLQLGLFPLQIVTRLLYPKFFIHGAQGLAASRRFALRTAAPATLAVGVLSCLCVVMAAELVPAILGKDFASTTGTTRVLALALPLIALQYPAGDALTGAGRQGLRAAISGAATFGFGLLMVVGASWDGVSGLSVAFVLGHALLAAVLWGSTVVATTGSRATEAATR